MRNPRPPLFEIAAAFFLIAGATPACQVPVFRYALERWIPDNYKLESASAAGTDKGANLSHSTSTGDALSLRYPVATGIDAPFFSAPDTPENLALIPDSPLRREILRRILAGDSAVWILVESGDSKKDKSAIDTLESALRQAESSLELPEGIIGTEEARLRDISPEEEENVLVSTIPLQIKFSVLRLSRDNPDEAVLLALLLNMESDLGDYAEEPIAFTFFGRGRILNPLVSGGITTDNILSDCAYLCGACSCQVKRENPGIDALFTADWDTALEGNSAIVDKSLPPLTGTGDVATDVPSSTPTSDPAEPPTPISPPAELADAPPPSLPFKYTYLIAIGAALLLITFVSFRALRRP